MSGLDKIIADIGENAQNQSKVIIEEAEKNASKYIDAERAKAEAECSKRTERAKKQVKIADEMAASSAELLLSQGILAAKVEIIDGTVKKAIDTILNYPDDKYFEAVTAVVLNNCRKGKGLIRFNEKDYNRLPADFIDGLCKKLPADSTLELCKDYVKISGGCVLSYGEIDENCSFDAIASSLKDDLRDKASSILF